MLEKLDVDENNWMTSIIKHLKTSGLFADKVQAHQLQMRAARYTLIDKELYKWGFSLPLLKCIAPEQWQVILKKIHKDVCTNHIGGQATSPQSNQRRLFLADIEEECDHVWEIVSLMLNFLTIDQCRPWRTCQHPQPMAIHEIGDRYHQATTNGAWESKICLFAMDYFTKWA